MISLRPVFKRVSGAAAKLPRRKLALAAAAAFMGWKSYFIVQPDQFGIRLNLGEVDDVNLQPGLYFKIPFVQSIHSYGKNTQIIDYTAGGCRWWVCENTADRNTLYGRVRMHYTVDPGAGPIGQHRWAMDGWVLQDGYWPLTRLLNDSVNAVAGRNDFGAVTANPDRFITDLVDNYELRLRQNNLPVRLERMEFLGFRGSWFDPYDAPNNISRSPKAP